jgi:cysteine-rich CPXCG protein
MQREQGGFNPLRGLSAALTALPPILRHTAPRGKIADIGYPRLVDLDAFDVTCPYCGEDLQIAIEPDVHGSFVQDCEVCCNPWLVRVERGEPGEESERYVSVSRADGSE